MSEFLKVVNNRRSANKFLKGVEITRKDIEDILEAVRTAPSSFNLQHAHYYAGYSEEFKAKMYDASKQYKVTTASGVVIVTGDKQAYQQAENIYKGTKFLQIISEDEFNHIIRLIKKTHESNDESFLHDEAIRNASLSAMLFMLAAKDKGWDTCPMILFDHDQVRDYLNIPEQEEIVLMMAIGKLDTTSNKIRGYRKPLREIVTFC
ncbi:MAG: nitroreductase family protein [Marinisporobacter sp.]|nr:nitroreductase family protein [Marinisporobacter sp.]